MSNRQYYGIMQASIKEDGDTGAFAEADALHGLQSAGLTTNFSLEQVFQLGQLAIYENIEGLPDIEITMTKVLDGYPLIFHQATKGATTTGPTLANRSVSQCIFGMALFEDTADAAEGTPGSRVECSGSYISSSSFTIPIDGSMEESATLVSNNKVWLNTPTFGQTLNPNLSTVAHEGRFSATSDDAPIGVGGVQRRENLDFSYTAGVLDDNGMVADADCTILPPDVFGISDSGTNEQTNGADFDAHVQNITVSVDLGRTELFELGRRGVYHRYVEFPVEVTCDIEILSISGDMVSAHEDGIFTTGTDPCDDQGNLLDRTIRIATCEGTRIYLGIKNKLSSTSMTGGDAGGGNQTVTYSYSTFNDYTVMHSGDPHPSGVDGSWWAARSTYLIDAT